MRVELEFGKSGIALELPEGYNYRVLSSRSAQPLTDPAGEISTALDVPLAGPALRDLARGKRSAAIAVCDITRPAPNRVVLPHVLRRLADAGLPSEAVTILIATGLHRPATEREIREIVGEGMAASIRVVNHDARNLAQHQYLGETENRTPVYIDRRFLESGLHLTLGFIEPHLMLGYSGGRKLIAPGLAAQETIKALHSPKFMRDSRAVEGSMAANPLHRELLNIARLARHDFLLDVALTRRREIAGVFAGNPEEAHRQGAEFVARIMLETLDEPVDAVVTSSAGYPLDLTFYQSIKGITAAAHLVKPGGRILLIAACEEGCGSKEFTRLLSEYRDAAQFLGDIEHRPVIVDQWQLEKLALVKQKADLMFYVPGLDPRLQAGLWGPTFPTAAAAIEGLTAGLPRGARVAIVPEGPYVLARAAAAQPQPAWRPCQGRGGSGLTSRSGSATVEK